MLGRTFSHNRSSKTPVATARRSRHAARNLSFVEVPLKALPPAHVAYPVLERRFARLPEPRLHRQHVNEVVEIV
jgi:hypothetical protein